MVSRTLSYLLHETDPPLTTRGDGAPMLCSHVAAHSVVLVVVAQYTLNSCYHDGVKWRNHITHLEELSQQGNTG